MLCRQVQHFLRGLFQRSHRIVNLSSLRREGKFTQSRSRDYGRYGMGPESSTNFFSAAMTAGRVKSSQKRSISRRSSSCGMGLINFLAAARVSASYLVICAAVDRAVRRASPSPDSYATRPTACARVAFTVLPVKSKSLTKALPRSRFRRGIPPKPGINPKRNSGNANRAIFSAIIRSQANASSNPPPRQAP